LQNIIILENVKAELKLI